MYGLLVSAIAAVGSVLANVGTTGCYLVFFDEPTMPNSLIEK